MAEQTENQLLDDILDSAEDLTENKVTYITNTRIHISNNEVTIDLFYVAPNMSKKSKAPVVQRTHRIVMPLALAKNTGAILLQGVKHWEQRTGIPLPITPQNFEDSEQDESE